MREDERGEGEERERGSMRQEWGAQEGEREKWLRETHRPVAVGWKGSSKPFRHYLLFFTCQKECVRAVGVCMRERGACWSSERSEEEAGAPLIFSLCRAYCCSQTSGLTLITHIYRQGGGEGAERLDLWAAEELQIPSYPSSPLLLFCVLPLCLVSSTLFLLHSLLSHLRLAFYPPLWLFYFFIFIFFYTWHCTIFKSRKLRE